MGAGEVGAGAEWGGEKGEGLRVWIGTEDEEAPGAGGGARGEGGAEERPVQLVVRPGGLGVRNMVEMFGSKH